MKRRAKIVCTLGPATDAAGGIEALVAAGMDVARFNLSHGTHADHRARYARVRAASDAAGRAVGVLVDLQGPKIRLGAFAAGRVRLETGARFTITTGAVAGTAERASTTYAALPRDVRPGDAILVDDGRVRLEVLAVEGDDVHCRVIEGGEVSNHKGLNLPGVRVSAPALTAKDREDLRFALELRADLLALSFVRGPEDAAPVRAMLAEAGAALPVIAKIEKPEAVERLEAVIQAFDGLMVARGDLGVELPLEQVPLVQKRAIRLAREQAKPVIVATQMLESMITASRPTRAEVSDVANAVFDGADALMMSAETGAGAHPLEALHTMARIIEAAESDPDGHPPLAHAPSDQQDAIAAAAVRLATDVAARALAAFTRSGATARRLASRRSSIPLLAFTSDPAIRSQLTVAWGVETFVVPEVGHTDEMVRQVDRALLELGRGAPGDPVVIVAGTPPGAPGSTNTVRVHRLGDLAP